MTANLTLAGFFANYLAVTFPASVPIPFHLIFAWQRRQCVATAAMRGNGGNVSN
jgi:hypothetical protein